ncbi:MAG TPA: bifunctional phosphopantothenoylcysteine decarboxylase/phosphopantothenate--cysteine ligase CoaBC, partial [Phycisphaerae bacterium]|nr:bifunctional phosphopantothenoylcysteine decarboxylase/phosphopantothenate--cysteine ligase CoaBC [Phycisphaerae bacterium]
MRILITAGPTREYLDSIRFLSNGSTGQMGFATAEAAVNNGHDVTLLAGPVNLVAPAGCRVLKFVSVADLQAALAEHFDECDVLIMV